MAYSERPFDAAPLLAVAFGLGILTLAILGWLPSMHEARPSGRFASPVRNPKTSSIQDPPRGAADGSAACSLTRLATLPYLSRAKKLTPKLMGVI